MFKTYLTTQQSQEQMHKTLLEFSDDVDMAVIFIKRIKQLGKQDRDALKDIAKKCKLTLKKAGIKA